MIHQKYILSTSQFMHLWEPNFDFDKSFCENPNGKILHYKLENVLDTGIYY